MLTPTKIKTLLTENGPFYALGLLIALGLKYYYTRATADDLGWILIPTSRLVELLTGIPFEKESLLGLVNHSVRFIIAPACAGINFLTIAFSTFFFSFLSRLRGTRVKILWVGLSMGLAYLLTLGANALRIIASIHLYGADFYAGWITMERVHRIGGTLIYFISLLFAYLAMVRIAETCVSGRSAEKGRILQRTSPLRKAGSCLVPFFWYVIIGLGIPLLNMAYRKDGAKFTEHFSFVISACLSTLLFVFLLLFGYQKLARRMRRPKRK